MDDVWKLLITATSVLLAAIAGNLIAAFVARKNAVEATKNEHRQWLRNARMEAYVDFLAVIAPFNQKRLTGVADEEHFKALYLAIFRIQIVGSEAVVAASKTAKLSIDQLFNQGIEPAKAFETIYTMSALMKDEFQADPTAKRS